MFQEYDPKNAMMDVSISSNGPSPSDRGRGGFRGRSRGRGHNDRGGYSNRNNRAAFSHAGPNSDRSITSVVVEQIPEEQFSEQSVREFFSDFGKIVEVNMQAYKRLAIVKYEGYSSAKRAYDSPKVIFDNRFVKVYWYKPESVPKPSNESERRGSQNGPASKQDEEMIDPAELEKKQIEAQKAFDEKAKRLKEAETQREELEKKLKLQAEERKRLLQKLSAKTAEKGASSSPTAERPSDPSNKDAGSNDTMNDGESKKSAQTDALRQKLAELEAEAESMGINPQESYSGYGGAHPPARGGAARGRRAFYRGAPRGRGSYVNTMRGGAVKRLDNRTKKVAVSGVEFGTERDEALRQHLFVSDVILLRESFKRKLGFFRADKWKRDLA